MRTEPNIRLRADGRYEARYKLGRKENGKTKYGFCYGSTYEEAYAKRKDILEQRSAASPEDDGSAIDVLDENQVNLLTAAMISDNDTRRIAVLLMLHIGISSGEVCALQLSDIDFTSAHITIKRTMGLYDSNIKKTFTIFPCANRILPIPQYLLNVLIDYKNTNICYENMFIGKDITPLLIARYMKATGKKIGLSDCLTEKVLRNTFIRRCLECAIDLNTICIGMGMPMAIELPANFRQYINADLSQFRRLSKYGGDTMVFDGIKHMSLLILGAGGQGDVVKETAEAIGIFERIAFLDDNTEIQKALDSCENYREYIDLFPIAYPSFGNNDLRMEWIAKLEREGFILPKLIHPSATVSPSAKVEPATIVEAKAIINAKAKIGKGCIISSGAIINHNAVIEEGCHIDCAVTVLKDAVVKSGTKVDSGTVFG